MVTTTKIKKVPTTLKSYITRQGLFKQIKLDLHEKELEPEIRLGRTILDKALLDAFENKGEDYLWFDETNEDFLDICTMANLEPEETINRFKETIKKLEKEKK